MSLVSDLVMAYLPAKKKTTPSGWTSFNAPCCIHNGENADQRQRGGIITRDDTFSYHCFNCGFKASWQPGRNISYKMRKLLQWLNVPDNEINQLALNVLRFNDNVAVAQSDVSLPQFDTVPLPNDARLITDDPCDESRYLCEVKQYMRSREMWIDQDYEYYWSPNLLYRERVIIPFIYEGRTVGWTARKINEGNPRYLMESQPGYVYGLDQQRAEKIFCIVTEGPIDAQYIEGCALMGSEISQQQALLLNRLNKDIIVVPDRDSKGQQLINQAVDLGWQVSMPEWSMDCKDIGDAVLKYGRLYTLYSIVTAAESSNLKIRLREKKWFT